jgi:prepilin-type N-terminal cleavage/methylation domain-containing protein
LSYLEEMPAMFGFRAKPVAARNGLTLMELIVVLMILVALAGIIIPMLPSMLTRAHVATHTTNVTEITKLIITYQATHTGFPDQWDAMTNGTTMINYMAGGTMDPQTPPPGGQAGGVFTQSNPTQGELNALNAAGIGKVHMQLATPGGTDWAGNAFDPTFANYSAAPTAPTTIGTSTALVYIDPQANGTALTFIQQNYPSWSQTGRYIALGIGPRCTMIGTNAVQAPVHFSDTPDASPAFSYARFVAIFKVSDTSAPGGVNMAQLVGVAAIHSNGPNSLDSEFQNWNQLNNGGS